MAKRPQRWQPHKAHWTQPTGKPGGAPMIMTTAGAISWGVLRRRLGDHDNDLREFTWRKLTHSWGEAGYMDDWRPTAAHAVALPIDAPADLLNARKLAERYEADAFVGIKDLAMVVKIPITSDRLLIDWPRIQTFGHNEFAIKRRLACVSILHVPARSGVRRAAHAHLVVPGRELNSDGFGSFVRPLASDADGPVIAAAWAAWP